MNPARVSIKQETKESSAHEDEWLGADKVFHFVGSFLMVGIGTWAHSRCHRHGIEQDIRFGTGLTFSLGMVKELLDERQDTNRFSWKDMVANVLGIFLAALIITSA
jgi:uncharacterized protein YfiM (DUF2279 family)